MPPLGMASSPLGVESCFPGTSIQGRHVGPLLLFLLASDACCSPRPPPTPMGSAGPWPSYRFPSTTPITACVPPLPAPLRDAIRAC